MRSAQPMKKIIYLPIEIKARELDAKLLFTYYALHKGYRVIIGEQLMVEEASIILGPGIFFSKGYSERYRRRVVTKAHRANHTIVELDEEGFIFHDPSKYIKERMNEKMMPLIAQEYCWGPYQQDTIVQAYPEVVSRCYLTGNPRFDLLKKKYRSLYEAKAEVLQEQYGDFILINTRFALYNHFRGKNKTAEDTDAAAYIQKLYFAFLKMVKALSIQFPSEKIVVRPHPSEDVQSYKKELASYKNVIVRNDGCSTEWITASRVVIHNGCTTGIEAVLLETPVISYLPFEDARYDVVLPNSAGVKASSLEELIYYVEHPGKKKRTRFLNPYYQQTPYAHEAILPLLSELPVPPSPFKNVQVPKIRSKHFKHRFPSLKIEEVRAFLKSVDQIEGRESIIRIKEAATHLFDLSINGR
ncbi:surface carbohydrate biosynthesis protein [Halobacillus andaensis]|uniref:surface carbohydrate biosynthesis protein n=1 Tax=Halobacillus andaensis TaxID=1176239 RepID=UPI003D742B49